MRRRTFTLGGLPIFIAVLVVGLVTTSASAQSRDPFFATFSANYDFIYHQQHNTSNVGAHFDFASTVKRDVPILGLMGEAGFNHFEGATVGSFLGGPRLRFPDYGSRVLPFAQLLVGLYHCGVCDVNDLAIQVGGGVDFRMPRNNFRIRTQVDLRHVFDDAVSFNAGRLSAGVVIPLNR